LTERTFSDRSEISSAPLSSSFVFGPGNVDYFVHVSETFSDNAPVDELLAALRS
jgi:hypothetical protein